MTITRLENTSHPANHLADPKLEREARKLSRGRVTKKKMGWLLAKVESHKITREEFSAVLRRAMEIYNFALAVKEVVERFPEEEQSRALIDGRIYADVMARYDALMSEYDTAVAPKVVFVPAPSATRH